MERESTKHSPRLDEQLEHETGPLRQAGHAAHSEEWRQAEPVDEPHETYPPGQEPGMPAGLTPEDAERRSEIARFLQPGRLPATGEQIRGQLAAAGAPDDVLAAADRLDARREYASAGDVARAVGLRTEDPRDGD